MTEKISLRLQLDVQNATRRSDVPSPAVLRRFARAALLGRCQRATLTLRIVGEKEGRALNANYRGKDYPTNVLSFVSELPLALSGNYLGDLVICAAVVAREAKEQHKALRAHWAHMVVHGALHLLGYDHLRERDAVKMENEERRILARLNLPDPYLIEHE